MCIEICVDMRTPVRTGIYIFDVCPCAIGMCSGMCTDNITLALARMALAQECACRHVDYGIGMSLKGSAFVAYQLWQ